jgi:SOS-response transcriptional repressor LexA
MAENDGMVLAFADGRAMVTKFYIEDGGTVRLQPRNEQVKPTVANKHTVEICGLVVAVIRKYSGGVL